MKIMLDGTNRIMNIKIDILGDYATYRTWKNTYYHSGQLCITVIIV